MPGQTVPYVLDSSAAGTLFMSLIRIQSFEQDAGSTNSATVRCEASGLYLVQRVGAIAEAVLGS